MKKKHILVLCVAFFGISAFGHDQIVHEAITVKAAASAYADSPACASFIDVISTDLALKDATNSIRIGSYDEDFKNDEDPIGGYRSINHFYDPITKLGLSENPWPIHNFVIGQNSFVWGSISNSPGVNSFLGSGKYNKWAWPNARYYEWLGLTATNHSDRQAALTNMFRSVGQVMHLLEDTTQPQHVRNEQHLETFPYTSISTPWRSPIEDWGNTNVANLNYGDGSMLDWKGDGFTKLEDFWDRGFYRANGVQALDDDASGTDPTKTLGLAEWCNGNFVGDRHKFGDYYKTSDIRYYPYPSRSSSTDYNQKLHNQASGLGTWTFRNGTQGKGIYLNKTGDGVQYNDISRFTYLGTKFPNGLGSWSTTIKDDNVLSNYHNVFIPKAVQYSAGLLDYFFRGNMEVSIIGLNTNTLQVTNLIVNTSGQDFHGGAFYWFQEDSNSVRTLVQSNNWSGTFTNGQSLTNVVSFTNELFLVYQGTIGYSNSAALDPVDANIGIAAARASIIQTIDYPDDYRYYEPTGFSFTTNLVSQDFPFVPQKYSAVINTATFDDFGSIGGTNATPTYYPGAGYGYPATLTSVTVDSSQITVVGNHLSVSLTATDSNVFGPPMGYKNVSITWRVYY